MYARPPTFQSLQINDFSVHQQLLVSETVSSDIILITLLIQLILKISHHHCLSASIISSFFALRLNPLVDKSYPPYWF